MITGKKLNCLCGSHLFLLESAALETTRSRPGGSFRTYGAPLFGRIIKPAQFWTKDWNQALTLLYDRGQVKNLLLFCKNAQQGMSSLPQIHHWIWESWKGCMSCLTKESENMTMKKKQEKRNNLSKNIAVPNAFSLFLQRRIITYFIFCLEKSPGRQ